MTCSKTIWVIKKCVRYLSEMTNVLVATNVFRFCNELNFVWNNLSCWLSFQTIWYFLNGIDVLQMLVMTICFFVWWRKMKQRLHITTCIQTYWLLITRTYCSVPVLDFDDTNLMMKTENVFRLNFDDVDDSHLNSTHKQNINFCFEKLSNLTNDKNATMTVNSRIIFFGHVQRLLKLYILNLSKL